MTVKLTVICTKSENGAYVAVCPDVDGCYTQADTYEEAIENLSELVELTITEDLDEDDKTYLKNIGSRIISEIEVVL